MRRLYHGDYPCRILKLFMQISTAEPPGNALERARLISATDFVGDQNAS
jgi:hypothetical protein